jgi:hypothetical protein
MSTFTQFSTGQEISKVLGASTTHFPQPIPYSTFTSSGITETECCRNAGNSATNNENIQPTYGHPPVVKRNTLREIRLRRFFR